MPERRTLYLDCCAGITPALTLGALLDAGLTLDALRVELAALPLDDWGIAVQRRASQGIVGQGITLTVAARGLDRCATAAAIHACRLSLAQVWSRRTLDLLWDLQPAEVISLADVLGVLAVTTAAALLGVEQFHAAPLPLAPTSSAHWRIAARCDVPTTVDPQAPDPDLGGIALLAGLATFCQPALRLRRVGYGVGERSLDRPDMVRIMLGEAMERSMEPSATVTADPRPSQALIVVTAMSYAEPASPELDALLTALRDRTTQPVFGSAVARGEPDLIATLRLAAATGAQQLVVLPLLSGEAHPAMGEIAGALRWAQATWPNRQILCAMPALRAEQTVGLLAQRASELLRVEAGPGPDAATALLVLGEGSYDHHANAEVAQIARLVWEHLPEHPVDYAFVAHTRPTLAQAIERCRAEGARRIIVLPLTLIANQINSHAAAYTTEAQASDGPVLVAGPLLSAVGAAAVLLQRAREATAQATHAAAHTGLDPLAGTRWAAHQHPHPHPAPASAEAQLPPRYQGAVAVSAAPMGAADLRYDADGLVAWDQIWTDFCDLALAGGPPHRGTLLEPAPPERVRAHPEAYARVVAELARGLRLVTGLEVLTDHAPGWIGLRCHDEAMALWMLRAIVVENVSVRREGRVLFVPAGPDFRLEGEIKNVVTVIAKTHHYWTEHRAGEQ